MAARTRPDRGPGWGTETAAETLCFAIRLLRDQEGERGLEIIDKVDSEYRGPSLDFHGIFKPPR